MAKVKEIKIEAKGLREIASELDDIKSSLKEASDPESINRLTNSAKELEDQLDSVNNEVKDLGDNTENSMNGAGAAVSDLRTNLEDLDFKAIQDKIDAFGNSANISFKGAVKGIKSMSASLIKAGKKLLTNPYFLLAAVIVAIVVAVYKFLDSLGLIEVMMDALMAPIQLIIDAFYALTDALGITNKAATKAAQETADAWADTADSLTKSTESIVQDLDHQIKMAQINGESTIELERKKRQALYETAKVNQIAADKNIIAVKTELLKKSGLSVEEMKRWDSDAKKKSRLSDDEIANIDEVMEAYRIALNKKKAITNESIEFDTKVFNDSIKKEEKETATKEAENKKRNESAKAAREKREEAEKTFAQNRLNAQRQIEDLKLQLMEEGTDKEIALNKVKYDRLIEDTMSNETLTQEEKLKVKKYYTQLSIDKIKEIKDKDKEDEVAAQKKINDTLYELNTSAIQKQADALEEEQENETNKLQEALDNKLITQDEFNESMLALEQEFKEKKADITKGDEDEEDLTPEEEAEQKLQQQRDFLEAGLITKEEFDQKEIDIEKEKADKIKALQDEVKDNKIAGLQQGLSVAAEGLNAISSLMKASSDAEIAAAEGNEKKQEQLRKKAFEKQKKMQIAAAFINMAQGVIAGLGAPFPLNIAMPIIAGITGAASIAKIKSTTYQGGGGGTMPPPPSPSSLSNIDTGRQAPIVNFQGNGNDSNEVGAGGGNNSYIIENTVTVSETEITDKQKTVANLTKQSQL